MNANHKDHSKDNLSDNLPASILVLRTKTQRPPLRKEFIKREALINQLEENVSLPFTLISAATGCGKSVTTSLWLEKTKYKYGWLSLDEEHNDIQVFITYITTLLKELYPKETLGLELLIEGANLPANLIIATLINDLDQLKEPFVLVLDDYHMIEEVKIHEIINGVLNYPPEHFHLVILTQRDPPLKLARLRAQFRMNELRMKDLAFTNEEATELRTLMSAEISDEQVKMLVKQSEGWITGISIGLMGLKEGTTVEKVIQALHHEGTIISKLIEEVVVQNLPVETQKYLALTSLLDRFNEDLVQSLILVLDDPDVSKEKGKKLIKSSLEQNLFLIQLDTGGEWYRYHHLFQSQIKSHAGKHFSKEVIQQLYKETSKWFQSKNILEEAIKYAILSEDLDYAVKLFANNRLSLHNTEQFQRLERLINMFPKEAINNSMEILLSLAILQDHKADFQTMQKYLDLAGRIQNDHTIENKRSNQLKGQFYSVSSYLSFMQGDFNRTIKQSIVALELLPESEPNYFREFVLAYFSMAHQAIGKKEIGLELISRTLEIPAKNDLYFRGRLYHILTLIHSISGETKPMKKAGIQLQALLSAKNYPSGWMAGMLAVVTSAYILNDTPKVFQYHDQMFKYRFIGRPFGVVHHFFIECLASKSSGDYDNVYSTLSICKELANDLDISPLKGLVYAFEVEMALAQNNTEHAIEASAQANFNPYPPIWYYYLPQLTEVKLLFYTNEQEKSLGILDALINQGRAVHNDNLLLQALVLKSVLVEKMGERPLALEVLKEALNVSDAKAHLRTYVDHGNVIRQLLLEIQKGEVKNNQIQDLEKIFLKITPDDVIKKINVITPLVNLSKLSNRELEILNLVIQGYKNDEIAKKLFLSVDTIKKHLYNTYQKLQVKNRASAIIKALELGLVVQE